MVTKAPFSKYLRERPLRILIAVGMVALVIIGCVAVLKTTIMFGFKARPIRGMYVRRFVHPGDLRFEVIGLDKSIEVSLTEGTIQFVVDSKAPGTLLTVNDFLMSGIVKCYAHDVAITVRTEEQKKEWEDYLRVERERCEFERQASLRPRDVAPPKE